MKRSRGGFTLVETVVSGTILMILTLLMVQVLSVSNGVIAKSRYFRHQQESVEWDIIQGTRPSKSEPVVLEVGEHGIWEVVIDFYEADSYEGGGVVGFKTVRAKNHEE